MSTSTCPKCGHHGQSKDFGVRRGARRPEADRFWEKVTKDQSFKCWVWQGGLNGDGYGSFRKADGTVVHAHRWSWESNNGSVLSGMCVLHVCDNRRCVNPGHLFLGTRRDNNVDRVAKGRSHSPKLTPGDIREIRKADGTHGAIAGRYGVTQSHVTRIKNGQAWGHIKE